ncbi:MAG: zeta toxin family protein [Gammaproteobacteria bacterium]|nr:zeta toxin family protein [Gammaproteobacteria bacterium]
MAKLQVIDEQRDARVPFLRGMLTRSLQDAGLDFDAAYRLATDIRDDLDDLEVITTRDLRARIIEALGGEHSRKVLRRYRRKELYRENLQVVYSDGHSAPFSRNLHAQRLETCALPRPKCNAIARLIHGQLVRAKQRRISTDELTALTYRTIVKELNEEYADDYLIWNDFIDNDQPLLVLLGGVPGCGKSSVATDLANSLGIVRTQSTDMLREVMRTLIPERVSPLLHTSSFNAGAAVDRAELNVVRDEEHLVYGFQRQCELVEVACQAVLQRAVGERVSMIVEGVHIRPTLLQHIADADAVIVPCALCVLDKDALISRIKRRRESTRQRRAARYLKKIDDIWRLQSALLSEADNADIQILNNIDRESTVSEIIKTITATIAATYGKRRLAQLRANFR